MFAVLGIYLLGILLCLLAGVAVCGLTEPDGRWLGAPTLPVGMCTLIALLYYLGAALRGTQAAPVAVVIVLVGAAVAVWRLRRRSAGAPLLGELRRALHVSRGAAIALGGAVLAGALLLVPTMKQGFPTTIGVSNNDGWGYASLVEWLKAHPGPRTVTPDISHPLTLVPWSTFSNHFGFGFEHFATLLASLLGRDGFEVVNAAAGVAIAAAVGGWVMLADDINPRLGGLETGLMVLAVATPVLALPFAENYTTQFVSLCLWPVALSAFVRFSRRPAVGRLIVAAIAVGGVVGVYPAVVPWLVLPLLAAAVLSPAQPGWTETRLTAVAGLGLRERAGRAAGLLAALVAGVFVIVPIAIVRGTQNLLFLDSAIAGGLAAFFSAGAYVAYAVGALSSSSLFSLAPLAWSTIATLVLMLVVYLVAVVPWRRPRGAELLLAAVAAGVLLTTGAVLLKYRVLDSLPYQTYKGLTSGAAIFAGLVVVGLVTRTAPRTRTFRLLAVGCVIAVWLPVTSSVLQASADGGTGFRAADVQMGRELGSLPSGSVVLVEGAAPDPRSFQLRMMAAYFGTRRAGLTTIGLGSTASYLTPGGGVDWRPNRPWTDVLTTGPQPIATRRRPVWANAVYALAAAPPLDLTTFGTAWYPPETDGTVFAWTSGPSQLVLSNRSPRPRAVRLEFSALSYASPRTLEVTVSGRTTRRRLAANVLTPVSVALTLGGDSTTPVVLDASPGAATAPPGDGRRLMVRFQQLNVVGG